jgi:4-amino-4-deoxy-L-arabinose transferase-like glycosyltransferase
MTNDDIPAEQTPSEVPNEPAHSAHRLVLIAIVLVALVARTVGLGRIPPPLFRDEAEKGYNAYCLAKTGCDYEGRRLPLFTNVFGTYTSAIYQYASTPFVGLSGLEVWSTRLTAALVGTATVVLLFLLARALFDPPTALVAAAILALSPWHVCFSRWAQQGIFLPLLFTLAAWGVVQLRKGWGPGLAIAAAAIALAAYAYSVGRALAPPFLLLLVLVARAEIARRKRWAVVAALVLAVLVAPTLWFVVRHADQAQARFRRISIAQPGRAPAEVVGRFLLNYARHFDPVYLAARGDALPRHSPPGIGQIYPLEILLVLSGLFFLARRRDAAAAVVVGWLAIAPVASSMTEVGIPHALRSLAGAPAFALAAAVGLTELVRRLRPRARRVLIALVAAAELAAASYFLILYFGPYPRESAQHWQAGLGEALAFCAERARPGDEVWLSGFFSLPPETAEAIPSGEIFVAFWQRIAPEQFQQSRLRRTSFRVLPWGANPNVLLTAPERPPTFLIAFVGEMPGQKPLAVFADRPQPEAALGVYRFDPAPPAGR